MPGALAGIGGGIYLLGRKKTLPGILALVGFFLLAIEPLLDLIVWRLMSNSANPNYDILDIAYYCGSGVTMFLGAIAITLAFILAFRPAPLGPPESPLEAPPTG